MILLVVFEKHGFFNTLLNAGADMTRQLTRPRIASTFAVLRLGPD
jgi:hypothetical protein